MKPSFGTKIEGLTRGLVPVFATFFLLIFSAIPTHIPGFGGVTPLLPLMGVYYWAIYRPDLLPAWVAFAFGLLYDILSGTPMGVNALVLLLVQGIAASQRKFFLGKSFAVTWWAFSMLAAGSLVLCWGLMSILQNRLVDPKPVAIGYLLLIGIFPLMTWILAKTQVVLVKD